MIMSTPALLVMVGSRQPQIPAMSWRAHARASSRWYPAMHHLDYA
jgi:hypothetical protein